MKTKTLFALAALMLSFIAPINSNSISKTTVGNLKEAFKGETTAAAKYAEYAKKAKKEGYAKIALLFEAASKAESIHANNHKAVLEQLGVKTDKITPKYTVKSTKENLEDAISGEGYESTTMYPGFIKTAEAENSNLALISFNYAFKTEQKHLKLYKSALELLNSGKEKTMTSKYFVCPTCGNTYEGDAPSRCGISMTSKEKFLTVK
ncbi:MAG: rubrerythrin family protein [Bacteroidetes bacterium]|nr:rubrerythrin family protein [Bacteroidota bacterium]